MKRRVVKKRRAKHLRADRAIEKAMLAHKRAKASIWDVPEVARAMKKLEHAIDKLPPFKLRGKY
jgi:hypothetical protein